HGNDRLLRGWLRVRAGTQLCERPALEFRPRRRVLRPRRIIVLMACKRVLITLRRDALPSRRSVLSTFGRTAIGACLLLWLPSLAKGQMTVTDSPMDNPFADQNPGIYQLPDVQVWPGQAPCPAPIGPPITAEPSP